MSFGGTFVLPNGTELRRLSSFAADNLAVFRGFEFAKIEGPHAYTRDDTAIVEVTLFANSTAPSTLTYYHDAVHTP